MSRTTTVNKARSSPSSSNLPEPSHPFAKWGAATAIGIWALGVQSLPEPWNKIFAMLSAGVGYLCGLLLDFISFKIVAKNRKKEKVLLEIIIADLIRQQQALMSSGADLQTMTAIKKAIQVKQLYLIELNSELL